VQGSDITSNYNFPRDANMKIEPANAAELNRTLEEMYFPLNKSSTKFIRVGYNMFNCFEIVFVLWDRVTNNSINLQLHDLFRINLFVTGSYTDATESRKMPLSSAVITDYLKGDTRIIRFTNLIGDTSLSCTEATIKTLTSLTILYQYERFNIDLQRTVEDIFHFLRSDKCYEFKTLNDMSRNFSYIVDGVGTEHRKTVAELFYKFPESTIAIAKKQF
jgi:hypothetical protein